MVMVIRMARIRLAVVAVSALLGLVVTRLRDASFLQARLAGLVPVFAMSLKLARDQVRLVQQTLFITHQRYVRLVLLIIQPLVLAPERPPINIVQARPLVVRVQLLIVTNILQPLVMFGMAPLLGWRPVSVLIAV